MGRRKGLKSFAEQQKFENLQYSYLWNRYFTKLVCNMYEWENLPNGIPSRAIEKDLYRNGVSVFFKSKELGFFVCGTGASYGLNAYGEPLGFNVTLQNGFSEIVSIDDCVPIYNNYDFLGESQTVNTFSKRMENLELLFNQNVEQLKNPYMFQCPEGQEVTINAILQKKHNGEPYILTYDNMDLQVNNLIDTSVEYLIDKIQTAKRGVLNEFLTFYGINNVNIIKKERLIVGESENNDQEINFNNNLRYKERQKAVAAINKKYGLNISVKMNKALLNKYIEEVETIG